MKKVRVVLDGNGDFFHERAVWVTFAESKVTKQQVFVHCGERISELRFRVSFGSPQKKPKTLHSCVGIFRDSDTGRGDPFFAQQRGLKKLFCYIH